MIYFDTAATTKVKEEVIADIVSSLRNDWANPSSPYEEGLEVKRKIERARKQIADYINADPEEIIFTSSGSEANNLAIKGFQYANIKSDCILSDEMEHPSVYESCRWCEDHFQGIVRYCSVDPISGYINPYKFRRTINILSDTYFCLVSIMMANNEIGVVNPIKQLAKITHQYQGSFHTDATQAFGKIPIDVKDLDVDLMTVSLHKIGLPKGIGFLYKKKDVKISPIINGGHQEMDYRAGTENTAYIIAAGNQVERLSNNSFMYSITKDYLLEKIDEVCSSLDISWKNNELVGIEYLPNIMSVVFKGINAEALITLLNMSGVCVSAGSACCSGEKTPSRVLKAIGLDDKDAFSTIRISISEDTTKDECDAFVKILKECLMSLKMVGD